MGRKLIILFLLLVANIFLNGQSSYPLNDQTILIERDTIRNSTFCFPEEYFLKGKNKNVVHWDGYRNSVNDSIKFKFCLLENIIPRQNQSWDSRDYINYYNKMNFENCTIIKSEIRNIYPPLFDKDVVVNFDSCKLDNAIISNCHSDLSFLFDTIQNKTTVQYCDLNNLICATLFENDSSLFSIYSSKLRSTTFFNLGGCNYLFNRDSILDELEFIDLDTAVNTQHFGLIIFNSCFINSRFLIISRMKSKSTIIFNNCSFGNSFSLDSLNLQRLVFKNCVFAANLDIEKNCSNPLILELDEVDINKMNFSYTGNISFNVGNVSLEKGMVMYQKLLEKYHSSGMTFSYQNLDIEYKKYVYAKQGFPNSVIGFISKVWWFYGYKKHLVVFWIFFFITVFSVINRFFWKEVNLTYPIFHDNNTLVPSNPIFILTQVIVFTLSVFFSIKIDVGIVNFAKPRFVLFLAFQYLIGLVCVLFLVNAVLKF